MLQVYRVERVYATQVDDVLEVPTDEDVNPGRPQAVSVGGPLRPPAAAGCPDAVASFLQRSTWNEFRAVLAGLWDQCPTAMPVVVRTAWLLDTILGQCIPRRQRFVVRLNESMGEPQAVEVLCNEWAHALAWNFAVDRLIAGQSAPFPRNSHDRDTTVTHSSHSSGLSIRWSWVRVPAASLILTTSNRPLGTGQPRAAVPLVVRSSRATASLSSPTCRSFGASRARIGGADEP